MLKLLDVAAQGDGQAGDVDGGGTMFRHYVGELLQGLDRRADVSQADIAKLEWTYLRLLEHSSRRPKAIFRELVRSPEAFVDLLKMIFKPSEDSGIQPTQGGLRGEATDHRL